MQDQTEQEKLKPWDRKQPVMGSINLMTIIPIVTAYAFFISSLNLHLFWSTFDINIFSYLSASDIIVRSIKTLSAGLMTIFLFVIAEIFSQYLALSEREKLESLEERLKKGGRQVDASCMH